MIKPNYDLSKLSKYQPIDGHIGELENEPKWGTRSQSRFKILESRKDKIEGRSVLDIGCNNGTLSMYAKELGATRVVGVDKYDCIQGAREVAKEKGLDAEFWQLDLDKPEFKDFCPKFDVVFMFSMLTHLKDPVAMLKWIDLHTREFFFFETNCGAKHEKQIDLVRQNTTFMKWCYLGLGESPKRGIHHMWLAAKHIQSRRKKHKYWNDLPTTFIPLKKIVGWDNETLVNYKKNDSKFKNLKVNIKKIGLREPLIVHQSKGEDFYRPYEGGHRYLALKELGYTDVPCKIGMTPLQELEHKIKKAVKPYKGMPIALSGGIDSSFLAALMKPKFAISVRLPEGPKYDEIKYSKIVAKHLGLKHIVVDLDDSKWEEHMKKAVKAIGRPIRHFNIFALYGMYEKLHELGETDLVLGDGPDETMCGYARDLIISYLYEVYKFDAFKNYKPLIDKILPPLADSITATTNEEFESVEQIIHGISDPAKAISRVNMKLMREDMDDMADGIAKSFGITNHRPYQDDKELDCFMYDLPKELKISNVEYGKYALRVIADKYLPIEITWRKAKVGGPVYPVNLKRGWMDKGEFDKEEYLKFQKDVLSS